jgi:4,5-DOPA dioxygenase extradiol
MATAAHDGNHQPVIDFLQLGSMAEQAHPSYDHFLPLLYCLGVNEPDGEVRTFLEGFQWPAVSMRSFLIA